LKANSYSTSQEICYL